MAKWGEGDPRWIVQEREDGQNLNDWHWVEKSILPWAKTELTNRFKDLKIYDGSMGLFQFHEVKTLDGTICAHVRRGKRFVLYDYNVTFTWSGHLSASDGPSKFKGEVKIPYMGDENDFDDFEYEVTVSEGSSSERPKVKNLIHQECKTVLRKTIKDFMVHMNDVWTKNSLRTDSQTEVKNCSLQTEEKPKPAKIEKSEGSQSYKTISQRVSLSAPVDMIFQTFLDKDRLAVFTQSASEIDPRVGGAFSLFSGNVTGIFTEIIPQKKITQKWRFRDWKDGVYSTVTLTFDAEGGKTNIALQHENVPSGDLDRTKEGWNRFYWNNFRNIFGGDIGSFI